MLPSLRSFGPAAVGAAALLASVSASAQTAETSPWSVRLRATYLETVDKSSGALGTDAISVSDKLIPEFDIGYRINDSWSLELVLTIPQEHDVKVDGDNIGSFKHLPPTLLAQYHPQIGSETFRPYVGAGVNFTLIFDEDLAGGAVTLDSYSVGPALQLGCDVAVAERWAINFDVKRVMLRTDVELAGFGKVGEAKLDPWLFAIGATYQF